MVKYLMHLRRKDPSGGKMCLNYLISLEGLHPARWGMDQLFSFGLMFGMITSFNTSFQDYSFAKNKNISVAAFLQNDSLEAQFHLQEYLQLQ
jgi:hypothetical protein